MSAPVSRTVLGFVGVLSEAADAVTVGVVAVVDSVGAKEEFEAAEAKETCLRRE